eukprot:11208805-Lingulodinium_polyedra.AAC.1
MTDKNPSVRAAPSDVDHQNPKPKCGRKPTDVDNKHHKPKWRARNRGTPEWAFRSVRPKRKNKVGRQKCES